jgi:hypothetical protein
MVAAMSALYARECARAGSPREAEWAARQVYDALDFWIAEHDDLDFNDPSAEAAVRADPLVQRELHRQQRDLGDLARVSPARLDEVLMRHRATAEGARMFESAGSE